MSRLPRLAFATLLAWLPAAITSTALAGLVYAAVQHDLRISANDPQVQMAEDAAAALAAGQAPEALVPEAKVDLGQSLSPYLIVFDDGGRPLASSAQLDRQTPAPPPGVFEYVRGHAEDRFTWQPRAGVRGAVVVRRVDGPHPGFVLAGRSLREIERREDETLWLTAGMWAAGLVGSLVAAAALAAIGAHFSPRN